MWERCTEAARAAYWRADRQVRKLGASAVTPDVLLEGLLADEESNARSLLSACQVNAESLQRPCEPTAPSRWLRFWRLSVLRGRYRVRLSSAARAAIYRSDDIARELGCEEVDTEHILIALAESMGTLDASVLWPEAKNKSE